MPGRIILRTRRTSFRFRVCSGVKDLEKEVLKSRGENNYEDTVRWLYEQVKLSEMGPFPPVKTKDEEGKRQDYYVNTVLYSDDFVFKDPLNTFSGIENYKSIFWALRFLGRIFFKALWVDIISVWQPVENIIMVRWTIHDIPRILWESRSRFDGTSEYKLDKDGKIYEHKVHNIALNGPQKFQVLAVDRLIDR
ncbi:hypothetical protein DH2020_002112 [Rehmannia glutinosa]|uniref:Uncharacterized protein n=1 Tax=Rehmannia glutinosa TaxID=99300 RepID=A0ABR0XTE1_REHGL